MPQRHPAPGDPVRREVGLRRLSSLTVTAVLASAAATGVVAAAAHHSTTGGTSSSTGSSTDDGNTGLQAPPGAPLSDSGSQPDGVSSGS